MAARISARTLKRWLHDGGEIAVFDVREHGQYGEGHLFYGISLPFSVLEQDVLRLAPNRAVRLVVYDDDSAGDDGADAACHGVAYRAARQLVGLGYTAVHVLEGGCAAWRAAGHVLFKGVNLPSKAFGELVEQVNHTPRITAQALSRRLRSAAPPVVLDGRPFAEFQKMSIPQAVCCPNGELAYRIRSLVPDAQRTIVINCAGRTRSIIGAQTLINLGIDNPVLALENGTQGWYLDGLSLAHGERARYDDAEAQAAPRASAADVARAAALALRAEVAWVDAETVAAWHRDATRTVFLCDVRTAEEFAAGTLPGARHTPGGQLQQATDQYIGVRRAHLVLFDSDGIRAPVVASWLRQLGHAAFVLRDGLDSGAVAPEPSNATDGAGRRIPEPLERIDVARLARRLAGVTPERATGETRPDRARDAAVLHVVDLRASQAYREGHIPGARWSIRPRLPALLQALEGTIVLVSDVPATAEWAAAELSPDVRARLQLLAGGMAAWQAAGEAVHATPEAPADAQRIDYLFFTHDRHQGNKAAARQYLAWEMGLLAQLDADELADFKPLRNPA